jgi:hypothetical protein
MQGTASPHALPRQTRPPSCSASPSAAPWTRRRRRYARPPSLARTSRCAGGRGPQPARAWQRVSSGAGRT